MNESPRHRFAERAVSATNAEIANEKASSLGRAGRRLEAALHELRAQSDTGSEPGERNRRVDEAAEALYFYIVQREACGLRDTERLMKELGIPREVQLRMGTRRRGR